MKFIIREQSSRHAVIVDEDNAEHPWIATINTENAPGRAEAVLKAIEEHAKEAKPA